MSDHSDFTPDPLPDPKIRLSVFNQTEVWTDASGYTQLISNMTDSHVLNVMRYLQRNAQRFRDAVELSEMWLWARSDCPDDEWWSLPDSNPQQWLRGTHLYRALSARLPVHGPPRPVDPALIDLLFHTKESHGHSHR